jgi:PAS domain S-box-containing protein
LKAPLTSEAILSAALHLVDGEGPDSLTMRRLASHLGVSPMAPYGHFQTKEALLTGVVQKLLGEVELPPEDLEGWEQRVRHVVASVRATMKAHPNAAVLFALHPPSETDSLAVVESILDALRRGGFDAASAAHSFRLLESYTFGYVQLEVSGFFKSLATSETGLWTENPRLFARLFPRLSAIAPELASSEADDEFERGLSFILAGLRAQLEGSALITLEAQLAAIVQSSDDAIIGKTTEGIITSWNPAAQRLYGYDASEALGRSIGLIIPPHRAGEERQILETISSGEKVDHYETERLTKDGTILRVSLSVSPIRDANGQIVGASAIARPRPEDAQPEARA